MSRWSRQLEMKYIVDVDEAVIIFEEFSDLVCEEDTLLTQ